MGLGYASLVFVRAESVGRSRAARAITVAIATSFTLASGYTMILASFSLRLIIAAFTLAVAIGALFNFIFSRQRASGTDVSAEVFPQASAYDYDSNDLAQPADANLTILQKDLPSPLAQRIHRIRERARRFGE